MPVSSVHDHDAAHLFGMWSAVLADLYVAWNETNAQFAHVPSEGSPASRDDALLARARAEWTHREGTGAGLDAVQMVDAAAQYVLGLKSLADNRTLVLAPWPVARAVAEHVAHAAWLLEPGIRPEARMARRWMARLAGAHRYRWMAGARNTTNVQERDAKKCRENIREELLQRFPDADTKWTDPAKLPPWTIAGETYPTLRRQSRLIEKLGVKNLAGVYDTLSVIAHPNPVTLTMLVDRTDNGGNVAVTYRVDAGQWDSIVRGASMLLYAAAHAACGYFALDTGHLEAWYDRFESARQ
jgi:hypothetical protein